MKGKPIFYILYQYKLNIYLTVVSVAIVTQLISFKTIELNKVSIFFMNFSEST